MIDCPQIGRSVLQFNLALQKFLTEAAPTNTQQSVTSCFRNMDSKWEVISQSNENIHKTVFAMTCFPAG